MQSRDFPARLNRACHRSGSGCLSSRRMSTVYWTMGFFVLAGSPMLSAADPLVPSAPAQSGNAATPVPPSPHLPMPPVIPPLPEPSTKGPTSDPSPPARPEAIPRATPPAAVSPSPAKPPLAPIPESRPSGSTAGSLPAAPSTGFPTAPTGTPFPWSVTPMDPAFSGVQPGYGWGQPDAFDSRMSQPYGAEGWSGSSQGFTNGMSPYGMPPYNSFATQPNFPPYFHTGPAGGEHARFPYFSYRRPWYSPGPISRNVNIVW